MIDSIQAVSSIVFGKFENYPRIGGNHIFFYETRENPKIEEALKNSLSGEIIDMSMFLEKLPNPPSGYGLLEKYFIALPYESKKEFSNHAMRYGNEISVVSAHELVKDFHDCELEKKKVFDRGFVLGAHMAGHLMISDLEENDGHCKDTSCCMYPHMNGLTDIDKIIEIRKKKNKREIFCKKSLEKSEIYLEAMRISS